MHYRKIWEKHNNKKIPEGYEIHHIDGNRKNNDPANLLCVSLEEHLKIHEIQEDWSAIQAILIRMNASSREKTSHAARKSQLKKIEENRHNFQIMTPERRSEISKKTMSDRIEKHGVSFLGIENVSENSKKAGLAAAAKQAGFLNTRSDNHGSKYVKNTSWWTNIETGERVRSESPPIIGKWKKGMKK